VIHLTIVPFSYGTIASGNPAGEFLGLSWQILLAAGAE